jgi:hypothetical protein
MTSSTSRRRPLRPEQAGDAGATGKRSVSDFSPVSGVGGSHCGYLIALAAICWHWESALVSLVDPAITPEKSCVHWLPTSWN